VAGEHADTLLSLRHVDLRAAYVERDGLRLELLEYHSPRSPASLRPRAMNELGFTHLSIRVGDLAVYVEELRARGVEVVDETRIDVPAAGAAAVMVEDPDGLKIELVQAPGDPAAPPRV
jgi:catechol 2,3-dioxygenase-like lactoylglutathione lyase family enzyme